MELATGNLVLTKAALNDVNAIHALVMGFSKRGDMLPRTLNEVYENLRDYSVVRSNGEVIACAALHIVWEGLAEIRSLAVKADVQSQGLGAMLVDGCLAEARSLGLSKLFALTYKPGFFEKLGFHRVNVMSLPHKVWNDCSRCEKFPNCDEIAVVLDMGPKEKS